MLYISNLLALSLKLAFQFTAAGTYNVAFSLRDAAIAYADSKHVCLFPHCEIVTLFACADCTSPTAVVRDARNGRKIVTFSA